MFVWTLRMAKKELIIIVVGITVFLALCISFLCTNSQARNTSAALGDSYKVTASNGAERVEFLSQFGWECSNDAVYVEEIKIPDSFSEEYAKYNELQISQGFDLSKMCGERVKLWKYEIYNYPLSGTVYATILVKDGKVVGGDISTKDSSVMHGFDPNQNAAFTAMAQLINVEIDRSVPDSIPADSDVEPVDDE